MNVEAPHTIKQLLHQYKIQTAPRLARRIQAVYLARQGATCSEIMHITAVGRRTVQQWIAKYNRAGLAGLQDQPRSGKPRKFSPHLEERFRQRIEAGPTPQDGVSVLNGPVIHRILAREFGIFCSLRTVHLLLHRLGYSYLCPRPQHEKTNPQQQAAFKKTSPKSYKRSHRAIRGKGSKSGFRMKPGLASKEP
jgi:transposase